MSATEPRADLAQAPAPVRVKAYDPDDWPESGEIRQVIVNAKWQPCIHGGGWWTAQDADGQRILLAPDGFLAALEAPDAGVVAELVDVAKRANEELRMLRAKDTGAVYDVTLRLDLAAALAKWDAK